MGIRNIALGADHAGVGLKNRIAETLKSWGYEVRDEGPHDLERVDYPDYAARVASLVSDGEVDAGVLVCGTGIGMSIAANKFTGVRAALIHDHFTAQMAREHNNANILIMGARLLAPEYALDCLKVWLDGEFEIRHQARLDKIAALEPGK